MIVKSRQIINASIVKLLESPILESPVKMACQNDLSNLFDKFCFVNPIGSTATL